MEALDGLREAVRSSSLRADQSPHSSWRTAPRRQGDHPQQDHTDVCAVPTSDLFRGTHRRQGRAACPFALSAWPSRSAGQRRARGRSRRSAERFRGPAGADSRVTEKGVVWNDIPRRNWPEGRHATASILQWTFAARSSSGAAESAVHGRSANLVPEHTGFWQRAAMEKSRSGLSWRGAYGMPMTRPPHLHSAPRSRAARRSLVSAGVGGLAGGMGERDRPLIHTWRASPARACPSGLTSPLNRRFTDASPNSEIGLCRVIAYVQARASPRRSFPDGSWTARMLRRYQDPIATHHIHTHTDDLGFDVGFLTRLEGRRLRCLPRSEENLHLTPRLASDQRHVGFAL